MNEIPGGANTPKDEDDGLPLSAEMTDRAERRALKAKARAEAAAQAAEPEQDEIAAALAGSRLAAARTARRRRLFKGAGALAGLALLGWIVHYLFMPYKGGMTFGICKTFLELNVRFPQDMRISTVDDFGDNVRIWYTQLDAFGEYRMENIQCHFRADEATGAAIDKITINRRAVDPQRVARFNKALPVILEFPPDLTIPYPLPDSLEDLQIETHLFRKPIL